MLSEKITKALNEQVNAEFYSAYMYLSMAAYFDANEYPGFANWMKIQFQEEQFHAQKMFAYINDRGGRINLKAIEQPPVEFESVVDVFQQTLKHEQLVTSLINKLVALANQENDYATHNFLQWFVSEQVEEEKNASDIVGMLKRAADAPQILFMLDQQFAQRVFTPPATA